jgi:hypothetical protein
MDELIGQSIKITLNSISGFVTLVGKCIRSLDHFILLETSLGPLYVCYHSIKTIQVIGAHHEEK